MMMRRHEAGKRGKAATAFTAAIRQKYARMMKSTSFLDSSIIATDELRAKKDSGPSTSVKLPICESLIADIRTLLWEEWTDEAMGGNVLYMGLAYGFETAGRLGEFTHCEHGNQDHFARVNNFTFSVKIRGVMRSVFGSDLADLLLEDSVEGRLAILECRVSTVISKGKVVVKPKLIARRSPEEAEFLDDLASWIVHSCTTMADEVFSFRKKDGSLVVLSAIRTRRDQEDVRPQPPSAWQF
jgi:hypothetical protein